MKLSILSRLPDHREMIMNERNKRNRALFALVAFIFLFPLACNLNTSVPSAQGGTNPGSGGMGTTRKNPVPAGKLISILGWDIKVIEFLRGEAALAVINTADWQAESLPQGQEYALAKVFLRCTSFDDSYHSLGISEMFISGSRNQAYGDSMDGWPQPEFLFEDMFTAEAVEGWIDAVIPTDEQDLIVVLDVENEDNRTTRFFALETGASVSLPSELANLKPNELGVSIDSPAAPGQQVISPAWEITLLDSIRGQEAETILGTDNDYYTPPAAGFEHLLLHVNLRYADPNDLPVWVGPDTFYAMDESGYRIHGDWIYTPTQSDRVWLSYRILPGAELEGWVPVTIAAGTESPVIVFDPDTYTSENSGENLRYLGVK
jgi:hypothetical protein